MKIIDRPRQSGKTTYVKFLALEKLADLWEACIEGKVLIIVPTSNQRDTLRRYFNSLSFSGEVEVRSCNQGTFFREGDKVDLVIVDECFEIPDDIQNTLINTVGNKLVGIGTYVSKQKLFKDYLKD